MVLGKKQQVNVLLALFHAKYMYINVDSTFHLMYIASNSAVHPQVHTRIASRVRAERESQLSSARVLDMSAIASVTRIPIYGIATDDYINFIVNIYGPAVLCFE